MYFEFNFILHEKHTMSFKNITKSAALAGLAVVFMSGAAFAGADKLTQAHDSLTAAAAAVQAARMDIEDF